MVSQLLGEGEGEVVSGRVEEKRKENVWVGAGHCCQKGEEMRVGGCKSSPSSGRGSGGSRKTLALASCKVFKGARSVGSTSRDTAMA